MKFELDYLEKLAKLISENKLTELTLEDGNKIITLKKEKEIITTATSTTVAPVGLTVETPAAKPAAAAQENTAKKEVTKGTPVISPIVGVFYVSKSPDSDPFVTVGQTVKKGQTVCIIEAMKVMNEIEAESSGVVTEICVKDGEPVEFGQVIMYVS